MSEVERQPGEFFTLVPDCRYGRFLVPKHDIYVGQALIRYGEYSQCELDILLQIARKNRRTVVVGANFGALAVPLAFASAEVIALEPQRWMFQLLCANVVLNQLTNVKCLPCAAGERHGVVQVPVLDPAVISNFGALELETVQSWEGAEHFDTVSVIQIDRMARWEMGLLVIDVEGMELDVLKGASATIANCRPIIAAEADRPLRNPLLFEWLRAQRYELFWARTPLFNPNNWRKDPENVYVTPEQVPIAAHNILAIPREMRMNVDLPPVLDR